MKRLINLLPKHLLQMVEAPNKRVKQVLYSDIAYTSKVTEELRIVGAEKQVELDEILEE
jgi:hypothetical protein